MNHFVWDFHPEISMLFGISLWPLSPRWYGLFFGLGIYLGYVIMKRFFIEAHRTEEELSSGLLLFITGTVLGARLGHCLFYEPESYLSEPWKILFVWEGGLASHGGVLGIFACMIYYTRKNSIPFIWLADRLALAIPVGVPFIRIGNFFNSEIYGKPTDVPWAVIFARIDQVPRHPAQLYEAVCYWIVALLLWFYFIVIAKRHPRPGFLLGAMLVGIFSVRFGLETIKVNQVAFEDDMSLNMGQILSIPIIALGIYFMSGHLPKFLQWADPERSKTPRKKFS